MEPTTPSNQSGKWYPLQCVKRDRASGPLNTPAPLLRIHACGLLSIEILCETRETPALEGCYQSLSEEQIRGRNGAQALTLLKLLISRPHRYAPKDYLMEHLGHGGQALTEGRLDDLVTRLRGLLCGEQWGHLRTHVVQYVQSSPATGSGYRLVPYPLLWLDVDALHWNGEHAIRLERHSEPKLACECWEQAYQLASCGDYLCDEAYSDWAQGRRDEVRRAQRLSVHALSRLLIATTGEPGEAQALRILSDYSSHYPTDEDVLRPLMELLGKHERFSEALACYERATHLLAEEELTPDEKIRDIALVLRTKLLRRQHHPSQILHVTGKSRQQTSLAGGSSAPPSEDLLSDVSALTQARGMIIHEATSTPLSQQESSVIESLQRHDIPIALNLSGLTALPSSSLLAHGIPSSASLVDPESITHCARLIEICYQLSEGRDLKTVENILWAFLPKITAFANQRSAYQQEAAHLAAQGYLIAASLVGHHNDLEARLHLSNRALFYSNLTQDRDLQVAALRQLAVTFDYLGQPLRVFQTYQRALPYLDETSPSLRACIYAALSGIHAHLQQKQETSYFIGLAYNHFPEQTDGAPAFLRLVNANYHTLQLWDALNHIELAEPQIADKILAQVDLLSGREHIPERIRIELLGYRALTCLEIRNLEQACFYLETAGKAAIAMRSKRRLQEVLHTYQKMRETWPHEQRVLVLGDLFLQHTMYPLQ